MEGYDTKCDCFSFSILLWEMLSCKPAFDEYSSLEFMNKVVTDEERLPVDKTWPPLTRLMIPEAWDTDPQKRPDMKVGADCHQCAQHDDASTCVLKPCFLYRIPRELPF